MKPPYTGIYINLPQNGDRARQLDAQIRRLGVQQRYTRFPAVDGRHVFRNYSTALNPGELGCWLSHLTILADNVEPESHLHIIEDDTLLAPETIEWLDKLLRRPTGGPSGDWDLLFTDVCLTCDLKVFAAICEAWHHYATERRLTILPLRDVGFAGTSSYVAQRTSVSRLYALLKEHWQQSVPIDLFIRSLVHRGAIEARVTLPFLTSITDLAANSHIRGELDVTRLAFDAYRRAIFVNADMEACRERMRELVKDVQLRPAAEEKVNLIRAYFTKKYSACVPYALIAQFADLLTFINSNKERQF